MQDLLTAGSSLNSAISSGDKEEIRSSAQKWRSVVQAAKMTDTDASSISPEEQARHDFASILIEAGDQLIDAYNELAEVSLAEAQEVWQLAEENALMILPTLEANQEMRTMEDNLRGAIAQSLSGYGIDKVIMGNEVLVDIPAELQKRGK